MSYKRFVISTAIAFGIYISFHLITYTLLTKKIFGLNKKESVGDLARLSYRPNFTNKRTLQYTLPRSHLYNQTYTNQPLDLVTIGDSFSYGGGYGLNSFYQDYLASYYKINVLNIGTKNISEYIEAVVSLHNTGWLKKHKTKYLLLESVVRLAYGRFAREIDWSRTDPVIIRQKTKYPYHQDVSIIGTANYKIFYYFIKDHFFHSTYNNGIYKFDLSKPLFTYPSNQILIYHSDISQSHLYTSKSIQKINHNLNKLAEILKKDGTQLIFMPVVDKYDLYYPYIKNNPYTQNPFFDLFRPLKKDYIFIDTKKILRPYLKKGIKDIWYVDDTHWNYKASKAITKNKKFQELFQKQ